MLGSLKRLASLKPRRLREPPRDTDRAAAIALAQLVVRKKHLGVALTPSESLLLARAFLQLVHEQDGRATAA